MKTEVKTLIAALTTERNSIDRAIAGLQQMSEVRDGAAPVVEKRGRKKGWTFSAEARARMGVAQRLRHAKAREALNHNGSQPETSASAIGVQ